MQLPHWPQISDPKSIKLRLNKVGDLLAKIGNPHQSLPPVIHIAGTNGKGSTVAYLEAIFTQAGYKVQRYTSPHLLRLNERIVINGQEVDDLPLNEALDECEKAANSDPKVEVTFFEAVTAAAFLLFSKAKSDILLLETGMGGRLDATNIIEKPLLSIITPISFDHGQYLGNTLDKIATEKSGIIKESCPVFVGKQEEEALKVIKAEAAKKNSATFTFGEEFKINKGENGMVFEMGKQKLSLPMPNLVGDHQIENASTAIAAALSLKQFNITAEHIKKGLENVKHPARLERITKGRLFDLLGNNYELFIDGGHNESAAKALASWIGNQNALDIKAQKPKKHTYLICGMGKDKNSHNFFKYLAGFVDFVAGMQMRGEFIDGKTAVEIATHATEVGIKSCDVKSFEQALKYIIAIHDGDEEEDEKEVEKTSFIKKLTQKLFSKEEQANEKNPARIIICGSFFLVANFMEDNNLKTSK
ncbi:MAG: bifunctional folylpolyglutamate synthase/dihydrofolate synthase [Proteobacteria bacterium]|nr:bifunctional folylpolyglutamate synthase/dihydrofolate synthase [Pseudomonadota bacterium]